MPSVSPALSDAGKPGVDELALKMAGVIVMAVTVAAAAAVNPAVAVLD
jgi:hypothetical protein